MKKLYFILLSLLLVLSVISLFIGVSTVTISDVMQGDHIQLQILLISRVPRLLSILITGVGMSISGLIMQQLTRNRFVSPTTAGTINFAQLGMLLAMLFFTNSTLMQRMSIAFISALAGSFLFMGIMRRIKFQNTLFVPLVGMMLGNIVSSITTFIALQYNLVQNISSWSQGSFTNVLRGNFELVYLGIPFVIIAFFYANKFTIVGMGEDFSKNLGLNYNSIVNIGLVVISLITASIVVTIGNIPFIGLIVPNIVTMWLGDNLKNNLGITAIVGAIFLLVCDIVSRLIIFPFEVTISLTVGIIGSVIFLYLVMRRKSYES